MIDTAIVIAKRPVAGRVKTRLTPPLRPDQAALLAAAALSDTLDSVDQSRVARRLLAFDGSPRGWSRPGWSVSAQPVGGLDTRLSAAFGAASTGPCVLIGMDTPQVRPEHLTAFDPTRYDACLGPAADGGYWLIGFRDPDVAAAALLGVPMSRSYTADAQRDRLSRLGLRVQELDELVDVDTIDDACAVAEIAPGTRFAAAVRQVMPSASVA